MDTTTATETVAQIRLQVLLLVQLHIRRGSDGINNTASATLTNNTTALQKKTALLNDGVIAPSGAGVASCQILACHQQHRAGQHASVLLWTRG